MNIKLLASTLALMLTLTACSAAPDAAQTNDPANDPASAEAFDGTTGQTKRWTNEELGLSLEGTMGEDGLLQLVSVQWSSHQLNSINWRNSGIRDPYVYTADITGDQADELIVVNIVDHGTGIIVSECHVLNSQTGEEVPVESLEDIIAEHVSFVTEAAKTTIVLEGDQSLYSDEAANGSIEAKFADWLNYTVADGKLIGSVQVSDGTSAGIRGYLNVTYTYKDGKLIKDTIEFSEDDPAEGESIALTAVTG
ncbi:hypothetical protein J40TS1_11330 [Paenibacillus montaniterrae]|uniref:Lipoprotein n=1 Tax=Paenibacillus montaniterrae TaxID=429341 RepID=A0A919YQG6_9BACL|nr:hypothetical protein [Paenibacillus montaniterrae]GIP15491.1 hypothetical protein J40TS1_11330 [Paenibacillus montaniterrae]